MKWSAEYSANKVFMTGLKYKYPWRLLLTLYFVYVYSLFLSFSLNDEVRYLWALWIALALFGAYQLLRFAMISFVCSRYEKVVGNSTIKYEIKPKVIKVHMGKETVTLERKMFSFFDESEGVVVLKRVDMKLGGKYSMWFDDAKTQKKAVKMLKGAK